MVRKHKKAKRKVRVVQANLGDSSDERVYADIDSFKADGAQLMGFEEHADRDKLTDKWIKNNPGWGKWAGDGRLGGKKTCILYLESLGPVTAEKSITVSNIRRVPKGAGPEKVVPKVVNRIRMRVQKRRLHFIVSHQYATIHNRLTAAKTFMRGLVGVVKPRIGTVIVVSDTNEKPGGMVVRSLERLFKSRSNVGGTHGPREIDRILVKGGKIVKSWKKDTSSDHDAVFADVEF